MVLYCTMNWLDLGNKMKTMNFKDPYLTGLDFSNPNDCYRAIMMPWSDLKEHEIGNLKFLASKLYELKKVHREVRRNFIVYVTEDDKVLDSDIAKTDFHKRAFKMSNEILCKVFINGQFELDEDDPCYDKVISNIQNGHFGNL